MRPLLLLLPLLLSSVTLCSTNDCRLRQPIALGSGDLLSGQIAIHDVKFDTAPPFWEGLQFTPATDRVTLSFFRLLVDGKASDLLGAAFRIEGKTGVPDLGFRVDGSRPNLDGGSDSDDESKTLHTREQDDAGETTQVVARIQGTNLTSVQLTVPVYHYQKQADGTVKLTYAGRSQDLCVVDGKL